MTEKNIVNVEFNGERVTSTGSLYQYDYGQILNFTDLELPEEFEIDFSFDRCTVSETYIGRNNQVEIPQKYLQISGSINCYIFLHEGEDDGETEYVVHVPVKARPVRTDPTPTSEQESRIDYLLGRLDQAVASASEYAEQAQQAAESFEGAVLYNKEQNLTDIEQGQAKENIGVNPFYLVDWDWNLYRKAFLAQFLKDTDYVNFYFCLDLNRELYDSVDVPTKSYVDERMLTTAQVNALISAYVDSLDASSERY